MTLKTHRKAMTLIELVLSMTILATIVSIAVISADDMGETSRYDETDRRGKLIQNAVVGYDTPRFLQDMGRMPVVLVDLAGNYTTGDTSTARQANEVYQKLFLAELVDLEADSTLTYNYKNALRMKKQECTIAVDLDDITGDSLGADVTDSSSKLPSTVTIKAGWAGPYALSGSENMTDNWGKAWDIMHYGTYAGSSELKWATPTTSEETSDDDYEDTNDEITIGTEIYGIRSIYSTEYASELYYKFPEDSAYADVIIKICDETGTQINSSDYEYLRVFLYLPYCPTKTIGGEVGNSSTESFYPEPSVAEAAIFYNKTTASELKGIRLRYNDNTGAPTTLYDNNSASEVEAEGGSSAATVVYPSYFSTRFDEDQTVGITEIFLSDVPVGSRKIWAYAFSTDGSKMYAPLQTVKITATDNVIELRLTETF